MAMLFVTYSGNAQTRFDREHYVHTHLPLVDEAWGPHGMESIGAFFPAGDGGGTIAACVMQFRDDAAIDEAVKSSGTPRVMADVAKFTDAEPVQSRTIPV